ncbi:MAG TPA: hypothetical protein VGJ89_09095 [Geothrix sp.]|jgi:hypothetical protein
MRHRFAWLIWGATLLAPAQDLSRLPEWAAAAAQAAQAEPGPQDAEAWVLLDRTEIAYAGDGEIRLKRMRLLKVLEERGTQYRTYSIYGLGGKASRVKRLKGWNLRPDGNLVKLDSDTVVTMNDATDEEFSTTTFTGAALDRVVKGSLLAFESLESIQNPLGPVADAPLMGSLPVRAWELDVAKKEGWFTNLKAVEIKIDHRHFQPWVTQVEELAGGGLRVRNLAALPIDEGAHPHGSEVLPVVQVRFLDPKEPLAAMWGSWDAHARWVAGIYGPACQPSGVAEVKGGKDLAGLRALAAWMGHGLTYKQVYLSPERGWVPEQAPEVGRKRYGDCKDLTAFLLGEAKRLGYSGAPVLARIVRGRLEADEPPFPRFNHVIAGIRLEATLGLPAEVSTPQGRFLLVDPTDPFTPIGYLSAVHDRGRVMICLPEGAAWVEIPHAAILPQRLSFDLKGEVAGRELKGALVLSESGGYWGLRATARQGGTKAVHDLLLKSYLDLPPTARLDVETMSDPLDLDHPFEVALRLKHPDGLRILAGEGYLADLGVPWVPGVIQRVGRPRHYPVVSFAQGELAYRAEVKFANAVKPFLSSRTGESPFRSFSWTSQALPVGGGTLLKLSLDHRFVPVRYSFETREEGLKAWKQDRSLMKMFRDDALALRMDVR